MPHVCVEIDCHVHHRQPESHQVTAECSDLIRHWRQFDLFVLLTDCNLLGMVEQLVGAGDEQLFAQLCQLLAVCVSGQVRHIESGDDLSDCQSPL
jgi:hypothetical protein